MQFKTLSLSLLATLAAAAPAPHFKREDTWGGAVSLGPTDFENGAYIDHAVTYLSPGAAPENQNGLLFLWPGMSNGTGDLVQTTLEDYDDNSWCGAVAGEWCVRASVFGWFGQHDGEAGVVKPDDTVKIDYKLEGNTWIQTVTNDATGEVLSSYESDSGPFMTGYGTGTECNEGCTGTVSLQTYRDTVITLQASDPAFGDTISTSQGATYSGLSANEDSTVWTIKEMNIPAMQ